jgi:phosphoadenosine phosphosulfate reductase
MNEEKPMQPDELLKRYIPKYYPRIAIASSFSVEDTIIIDMATKIEPQIKVLYIDTAFHFKETDEVIQALRKKYDLNLVKYSSLLSLEEQKLKYGPALYERDPDLCCQLRKVEPIKRALHELDAWIAGLRREQSSTRRNIQQVEQECRDDGRLITKLNPLATWTKQQVWQYIADNRLPYNALYDKGYTSIGCAPCTRPVSEQNNDRAGRWAGKGKLECGIHTFMKKTDS